jgi:hypothetical protein
VIGAEFVIAAASADAGAGASAHRRRGHDDRERKAPRTYPSPISFVPRFHVLLSS